ncbi:Mitochondrial chaperone Frataxin [Entomortierella beljakovae]|nr:Mitochondrial chaperone Frataxin [Entomortierella beljakovae]
MSSPIGIIKTFRARAVPSQLTLRQLTSTTFRNYKTAAILTFIPRNNNIISSAVASRIPTVFGQPRSFSSSNTTLKYSISDLSEDDYHTASDESMDRMVEYFEDLGDEYDIPGYDVEYQSGVMTLKLGDKGTYVVNKQPPNKQLWLSSPTSGPKRYDYDSKYKTWFYNRDHHTLKSLLDTEITKAIEIDIDIPLDGNKE